MIRRFRFSLLGPLFAVLVLAGACGDDGTNEPGVSSDIVLKFDDGALVGGVRREAVDLGSSVTFVVEGDLREQIHVHGYDLYVEPGDSTLVFDALIPGRFEIELETSGQLLVELTVS